jgi:hypothetical protein
MEQAGRSMKGQLRQAGRVGAGTLAIVGRESIRVRAGGAEQEAGDVEAAIEAIESVAHSNYSQKDPA